ncbi:MULTISPECIES: type IX secretion system motor protein PorM/GldM [Niastella]|uniref:Gliding motility protein GldM n=1 Tax=Niastella soli TaxID=2821487 RepID=A0ABS3YSS9_9BACT|nr:gliding motility protein GldM [Niastella soli]MBO9200261.1 gliding motility protein GldM [Niastella soli]
MALPKEPRQKMINMMYLVLTALLALNVSSEILNAFVTVNGSITKSNDLITDKNKLTYESFAEKLKDPTTHAQAEAWAPKAEEAKKLSADLFAYIEALKADLEKAAGTHENHQTGKQEINADNLDAAIRIMDKEGKGAELYKKLGAYKTQMLALVDPSEKAHFENALPIDLTVPASKSGNKYGNDINGWIQSYYHMTPAIAALTILSKFQNDVKNSEAQVVDYLHSKIGTVKLIYNKFQVIATANTNYAMPGDPVEITAGVGAFSDAAKPKITINGQSMPITAEGTALFKTTASGTGDHPVNVVIEFQKPDGTTERVNKTIKYTVGVPSGASVFLEKMNVLYIGVDNPLTVSGGSVGAEKTRVTFADGSITKGAGGHYTAKPSKPGMSEIVVNADGKTFKFPMRLKYLPPPAAFIGGKKGGSIASAELKAIGAVIAKLEESDFEAPYKVLSYKVGAVGGPIQLYQEFPNDNNRWSGQAAALISRCGPGTRVFFDQIQVVGPDGRKREIPGMNFTLK